MARDSRLDFARKWAARAFAADDIFDTFIYAWISLVIAAKARLPKTLVKQARCTGGRPPRDADFVAVYFTNRADDVSKVLGTHNSSMSRLAKRQGTGNANPIVDTGNEELRKRLAAFTDHYAGCSSLGPEELSQTMGLLLNAIRNNLLHGEKVYDDREDRELLGLVNPILLGVLEKCEGFAATR